MSAQKELISLGFKFCFLLFLPKSFKKVWNVGGKGGKG